MSYKSNHLPPIMHTKKDNDYSHMTNQEIDKLILMLNKIKNVRASEHNIDNMIPFIKKNDHAWLKKYIDKGNTKLPSPVLSSIYVEKFSVNNLLFIHQLKRTTNWNKILIDNKLNFFHDVLNNTTLINKYCDIFRDDLVFYIHHKKGFLNLTPQCIDALNKCHIINFQDVNFIKLLTNHPDENLIVYSVTNGLLNVDEHIIKHFYSLSFGRWNNTTTQLFKDSYSYLKDFTFNDYRSFTMKSKQDFKLLLLSPPSKVKYLLDTLSINTQELYSILSVVDKTYPGSTENFYVIGNYIKEKQPELISTFSSFEASITHKGFKRDFNKINLIFQLDKDLFLNNTKKTVKI